MTVEILRSEKSVQEYEITYLEDFIGLYKAPEIIDSFIRQEVVKTAVVRDFHKIATSIYGYKEAGYLEDEEFDELRSLLDREEYPINDRLENAETVYNYSSID